MKIGFLFGVIALIGSISCKKEPPIHYHYEMVFDVTDTFNIAPTEQIIAALKQQWGLDEKQVFSSQITVVITSIDQSSRQRESKFLINPSLPWYEADDYKRLKEQKVFLEGMRKALKVLEIPKVPSDYSYVMRNLAGPLDRLSKSDADEKILYVFSDMIQNNPYTVSFYPFRPNPEKLIDEIVYDSLSKVLLHDTALPDVEDVNIKVVHIPSYRDDELYQYTVKWWERFFAEVKIKEISFTTNI